MKQIHAFTKFIALFTIALFCNKNAQGQNTIYTVLIGDTTELYVTNLSNGSIQWQQSTDSLNWSDIISANSNPQSVITTVSPTGKRYFRAKISDSGFCANFDVKSSVICCKILTSTNQVLVGDLFHGGIVFHTDGTGNGLIAPQQDQSNGIQWGCFNEPVNTNTTDGATNTTEIITVHNGLPNYYGNPTQCSTYNNGTLAARLCDTLTINGYSDWYLPAKDQLNYLYQQRLIVGGFDTYGYWSSTEDMGSSPYYACFQIFGNGFQSGNSKYVNYRVRSIRSFSISENFAHVYSTSTVTIPPPYENEEICLVSVDTVIWKNKIMWQKTNGVGIEYYLIYKENGVNNYSQIGNISATQPSQFIDLFSVPEVHGDKYKISILDTCGHESGQSFYHKTMNLVISSFGSTMGLMWDDYVDESGTYTPFRYYIYRGTSPLNMTLLDSVSGSFNTYNDINVFNVYYYMIGVKKNPPCNINGSLYSFSNKKDNSTLLGINNPAYGTITVSPNPFSESTIISIPNILAIHYDLQISDITGKVVRSYKNISSEKLVIKKGDLKSGVYFVEVTSRASVTGSEKVYRGKLVVE